MLARSIPRIVSPLLPSLPVCLAMSPFSTAINLLTDHTLSLPPPYCHGMTEHPSASIERARLSSMDQLRSKPTSPLAFHISHGLAYTVGSALGSVPPSREACLAAFVTPNKVGLTAGARAWSKHAHRSRGEREDDESVGARTRSESWWGTPSGPVASINERAFVLFSKVMDGATWRNLHWLPHQVLVYEARVPDGYGMRWSQDRSARVVASPDTQAEELGEDGFATPPVSEDRPWIFRGFVEPMMDNGHEVGWRH